MDLKQQIISTIDEFYTNCVGEFRDAEAQIALDSQFRRLFKKKNYAGNIALLHRCRKRALGLRFPKEQLPEADSPEKELVQQCEECIRRFIELCDSYTSLQTALEKKAEGEDVSYREYNKIYKKTKEHHASVNRSLHELDILYAEYVEEEGGASGGGSGEFLTYDDILRGED